ncbi:PASTA domain-containing protein [Microbacterium sp. ZW T5_45]|uniref:PASTA domain-containing protein n=1 Tax=Microbacterium sp. ZW T5_45 TaxID=3378080 RepID=UPI00385206AE
MAAAYAAVAGGGLYCAPRPIDRVTDADGVEIDLAIPACSQALTAEVAATAASALQGVMQNGTGRPSRVGDGTPLIGKTGTHQSTQTWMDGSSTRVATVVWVGNVQGTAELNRLSTNGIELAQLRHHIWLVMQSAANTKYGGESFPAPAANLTRRALVDLTSVIDLPTEEATRVLTDAGFQVSVSAAIDGTQPAGRIARQQPEPGSAPQGSTIQLAPSNGEGIAIPEISGRALADALTALRSAGLQQPPQEVCAAQAGATVGTVVRTSPDAGAIVNRSANIQIYISRATCE